MRISLIIPCFNEEINIQKGVLDKIGNFTRDDARFGEVIIVDDGSTDNSNRIIKEKYLKKFSKFSLIENDHLGKAMTVITGIKRAKGTLVMFSDIDLATPIEESEKLIKEIKKDYSIVIGSRSTRREGAPILRKIMAAGFILLRDALIDLSGIKDTQCGFKIFNRLPALQIIDNLQVFRKKKKIKGSSVSAGFDIEFLFLAKKLGLRVKEVPVSWRHVETRNVNFFRDTTETLKDLVKIKYYQLRGKYDQLI